MRVTLQFSSALFLYFTIFRDFLFLLVILWPRVHDPITTANIMFNNYYIDYITRTEEEEEETSTKNGVSSH